MQKYGNTTDENGKSLITARELVGECVRGNEIVNFGLAEDAEGNPIPNRAVLTFKQSNGYMFNTSFFDSDKETGIKILNTNMLHICTKLVSQEEYNEAVKDVSSFADFINKLRDKVFAPNYGKKLDLKIIYKQNTNNGNWYAVFPSFPPFAAEDGMGKFTTNPQYDIYVKPAPPSASSTGTADPMGETTGSDDMPF